VDDSTRALVQKAQANDGDAVNALFQRYRERLQMGLRRRMGKRYRAVADSEDACHDAVLSALRGLQRYEYRGSGSFLAWLLRCAEMEILQQLRRMNAKKRGGGLSEGVGETVSELPSPSGTPPQILGQLEQEERLQERLKELPEREREVVILRRYMDADFEEIREEMDLPSAGAARALLSRAHVRLAKLMEPPDAS